MEEKKRRKILFWTGVILIALFLATYLLPFNVRIFSKSILNIAMSLVLILYIKFQFVLDTLRNLQNWAVSVVAVLLAIMMLFPIAYIIREFQINIIDILSPGYVIIQGTLIVVPAILFGVAINKLLTLRESLTTIGTKFYWAFTIVVTFVAVICISYLAVLFPLNCWCEPLFSLRSFSQASIVLFLSAAVLFCMSTTETEIQKGQSKTETGPS